MQCSSAVQGTLPQGADTRLRARAVTGKPAGAPKGERRAPRCNGAGGSGSSSSSRFVSLTCRTSCICSIDASDGCSAADARFWIVYRGRFRRVHDPHSCGQQLQRSLATRGVTADRRARCAARRPAWTGPNASPKPSRGGVNCEATLQAPPPPPHPAAAAAHADSRCRRTVSTTWIIFRSVTRAFYSDHFSRAFLSPLGG